MKKQALPSRPRRDFSVIPRIMEIPNLIEIQRKSYTQFLQMDGPPEQRKPEGLQAVFNSVFPIKDSKGNCSLEFAEYRFEQPKFSEDECRERWMTYGAPMQVKVRLVVWNLDEQTGIRTLRDIKEQEVYFGEMPLMTDKATFIVNGTERVVVNQLHRSPGVFFDNDRGKTHTSGKVLYFARIIPYRGSWIDLEFDHRDILFVRIDRRRKLPATILLRSLGFTTEELLNFFYQTERVYFEKGKTFKSINPKVLEGQNAIAEIKHPRTGEVIVAKGKKIKASHLRRLAEARVEQVRVEDHELAGRVLAHDIFDSETGEVLFEANEELDSEKVIQLKKQGINQFDLIFFDNIRISSSLRDTLLMDKATTPEESRMDIFRWLRPGDPASQKNADQLFNSLFFNPERYDLGRVGRMKINQRLTLSIPEDVHILTKEDIMAVVKYLIGLKDRRGEPDDIDHLGNRRVRSVGELLENQFRIGLVRMARTIKERMSFQEIDTLMPHDLINAKPVMAAVKEFFGSSQLSQFMDQTNPLGEITHKRRLSALGPSGLTRERAGFEVRDVHSTHYGRICPVETPEGPNIGLISSLTTYARVNDYGFIESPYRTVKDGVVTDEILYLGAWGEEKHTIAQANAPIDKKGKLLGDSTIARRKGDFVLVSPNEIDLMDVSPNQVVSVAASLVPFLEHDDANRALMGSNMQRQSVPLLMTEAPIISTGLEANVAKDSGACILARRSGTVASVDATRVVIEADEPGGSALIPPQSGTKGGNGDRGVDIYNLVKFRRSNQGTCLNQRPIVSKGDHVEKGQVISDGAATEGGELALGKNVLVAFMPWGGYNFEDSILVNERLIKIDTFSSIHIEEFECTARDTKLGREEITPDIPNVGEEALKDLDENGIVRIGAEVKPGDILVGKITPKSVTQLSPEEKLLRAIFGEKAGDVKDTSLRVPPGVEGVIIDAKVFSRKSPGREKGKGAKSVEEERLIQDRDDEIRIIKDQAVRRMLKMAGGRKLAAKFTDPKKGKITLKKDSEVNQEMLNELPMEFWSQLPLEIDPDTEMEITALVDRTLEQIDLVEKLISEKIERLYKEEELPPGVLKIVRAYVAIKRALSVGDKMAGRHGNKGVVSRILPEEDMPYLPDGTPVDLVLNPLGVPSRMNVGQILETHLGWAAKKLGEEIDKMIREKFGVDQLRKFLKKIYSSDRTNSWVDELEDRQLVQVAGSLRNGVWMQSMVFDGAKEDVIKEFLVDAGLPVSGQSVLFDGRNGEPFNQDVTVGYMYMLKLHHLVDEKIHARSIGPYSLVTQQPLGGKAQFGGQRLGEMEVWAIEAYGAAYTLQEFLTVKSDDIQGRTKMYENIVKGRNEFEAGLPESFNVLVKELQSLALNVELLKKAENE